MGGGIMALFLSRIGKLALTSLRRRGPDASIPNPPDGQGAFSSAFSSAFDRV